MRIKAVVMTMVVVALGAGSAYAGDAAKGQAIFEKKCKTCHNLDDSVKVGPGMKGVTTRRADEWLDKWLGDTKGMIAAGTDPTVVEIMKGAKVKMPTVKEMTDAANRADMIAFLKKNDGK
ncbi:MAG: cytochrome c [Nitrospinae bacterium]|nr:cytochrome c [Nitrospinota bacterium]